MVLVEHTSKRKKKRGESYALVAQPFCSEDFGDKSRVGQRSLLDFAQRDGSVSCRFKKFHLLF